MPERPAAVDPAAPGDLRAALDALGWTLARCRRELGVGESTVRDWIRDGPTGPAARALALELARRVDPPPLDLPPEADRDAACGEALDPRLDDLLARAGAAGWAEPEVLAAVLSWAGRRMVDGAGVAAALETVDGLRGLVLLRAPATAEGSGR